MVLTSQLAVSSSWLLQFEASCGHRTLIMPLTCQIFAEKFKPATQCVHGPCVQMGPSGSGKTTLLDVLAGRKTVGTVSGDVRIAGRPPTREFLRRYAGYVEQFGAGALRVQAHSHRQGTPHGYSSCNSQ